MAKKPAWSAEELERLCAHYPHCCWTDLEASFGRTRAAIAQKALHMGLNRGGRIGRWSEEHLSIMRAQYGLVAVREVAAAVGRTCEAVYKQAQEMNLCRRNGGRSAPKKWTVKDDDYLRATFKSTHVAAIAMTLDVTDAAVRTRAFALGLRKDSNRGITLPIGAERVARGVRERKVAATGVRRQDWRRVEVIEWEQSHGPVPSGFLLIVPRGTERSVQNLKLVRAEDFPVHAARQLATPHEKQLMDLKSQLGWQLSRLERDRIGSRDPGQKYGTHWTREEQTFLVANSSAMSTSELSTALGRSARTIQKRLAAVGVTGARREKWRLADDEALRRLYGQTPSKLLAEQLNRSPKAVMHRAFRLGIAKARS